MVITFKQFLFEQGIAPMRELAHELELALKTKGEICDHLAEQLTWLLIDVSRVINKIKVYQSRDSGKISTELWPDISSIIAAIKSNNPRSTTIRTYDKLACATIISKQHDNDNDTAIYWNVFNILLRDDKALVYVRIDYDSDFPTVSFTRRPLDDNARYFGPYTSVVAIKQALKLLRKVFPYATKRQLGQKRATLHYHLGLDPGLEDGRTSLEDYRANLRRLMAFISGKRLSIIKEIEKDMSRAAKRQEYEKAAKLRDQLESLKRLSQQIVFSDKEFLDLAKDQGISELVELLSLKGFPKRIEGYDISHMQGTDVVASMVVFTNGVSNKTQYRKFKTKNDINNDFFNMNETIYRRFSLQHLKGWGQPDLVLIDGGKGQLEAAINARDRRDNSSSVSFIGLAKREEQIVISMARSNVTLNHACMQRLGGHAVLSQDFILVTLPKSSNIVKLLQRVRDESHRFAVSYHSTLKTKRVTASVLEDLPGIGPSTRKKLLIEFGSIRGIALANDQELIDLIGRAKTSSIRQLLQSDKLVA
jgi:excinuclease ABC subunit C